MQTNHKKYLAPEIKMIEIDNEISLALESTPPDGPGEVSQSLDFQNNPVDSVFKV